MIIIINIISANIIVVTVVIFGHVFVDMALFTPCLLKGRSGKRLLYPRRNVTVPHCLSSTQLTILLKHGLLFPFISMV